MQNGQWKDEKGIPQGVILAIRPLSFRAGIFRKLTEIFEVLLANLL